MRRILDHEQAQARRDGDQAVCIDANEVSHIADVEARAQSEGPRLRARRPIEDDLHQPLRSPQPGLAIASDDASDQSNAPRQAGQGGHDHAVAVDGLDALVGANPDAVVRPHRHRAQSGAAQTMAAVDASNTAAFVAHQPARPRHPDASEPVLGQAVDLIAGQTAAAVDQGQWKISS